MTAFTRKLALRAGLLAGVASAYAVPAAAQQQASVPPPDATTSTQQAPTPPGSIVQSDQPSPSGEGGSTAAGSGDVVVTGTRIRGIAPVGAAVVQLDQTAIKDTGIQSTTEVLKSVPQIANIGSDVGRTGSNANGQAFNIAQSSGINLRGLGTQATLTLVDGRRPAPGGTLANLFDPSAIPTIALGDIEVLADGASALYGSDAIAGVVNLGLRKTFTGLETSGRYTFGNDYSSYRFSGIAGDHWKTGRVMVSAEFENDNTLAAAKQPDLFIGANSPIVQIASTAPVPIGYSSQTPLANFTLGGVAYAVNPDGTLSRGVKNVFSRWTGSTYLPQTRRVSVVGSGEQEITSGITLYAQGFYSKRRFDDLTARGGAGGASQAANIVVPSTNPYLQQFFAANGLAPATITANYAFLNSVGPNVQMGYNTNWLATGGMTAALPHDFKADLSFSYGSNLEHRYQYGLLNNNGLTTALNSTSATTAFNPFGPSAAAVLTSINAYNNQNTGYHLVTAAAKVDGGLFTLPAGQVKIAVGAEYAWHSEYIYNVSTSRSVPDTSGAPFIQDTTRAMDVASLYGEIVVPLFGPANSRPGFRRLDLSAAVRYDHFDVKPCGVNLSTANYTGVACTSTTPRFGSVNPKFGITWKPIDDFTLRASYGTSFRYNLLVSDPNGAALYNASTTYADAVLGTTTAVVRGGGFPELKPETAQTWTLGAEFKPEWAHGLELTATYFNVRYNNIIEGPTAIQNGNTTATSALYAPFIVRRPSSVTPGADDTAFNALIASVVGSSFYANFAQVPNTAAGIASVKVYVEQRNQNLGTLLTDGIDFTASYRFNVGASNWLVGAVGTKYFSYKRSFAPGQTPVQVDDLIDFPTSFRLRGQLSVAAGPLRANSFVNYTPSYINTYDTSGGIAVPVGGTGTRVAAQATIDLSMSLDLGKATDDPAARGLVFGVDFINLFDKRPAYALVGAPIIQTFDSSTASAIGRTISLRLSKAF